MSDVRAVGQWRNNADLIADVARLGYLDGTVLDVTYGEGAFWRVYSPPGLITNDLHKANPNELHDDYRALSFEDNAVDAVVFDPPYRMSGRRDRDAFDARYGLEEYRGNDDILGDLIAGSLEGLRVSRSYLLVKCQDQVNGGRVRWQTDIVTRSVEDAGGHKVDRFDLVTSPRGQPSDRRQRTARRNHSTLLVFTKERRRIYRKGDL